MEMNEKKDVAEFLFNKQFKCHIDTQDGDFYNGFIIELNQTFLVLNDRVTGIMPLPFSEIKSIEKFREEEGR